MAETTYTITITGKNDAGQDTHVVAWVITESESSFSNVVGGSFTTVGKPELDLPRTVKTPEGTSGTVDLNDSNSGGPVDSWSVEGEMPPGASMDANGVITYTNIGVSTVRVARW